MSRRLLLLLLYLFFSSSVISPPLNPENRIYLTHVLKNLEMHESHGVRTKRGLVGEFTSYQITDACLRHYNAYHGTRWSKSDLLRDYTLATRVAYWALRWYVDQFWDYPPLERIVLAVSGYNTGRNHAARGRLSHKYLLGIIPNEYAQFQLRHKLLLRGPLLPSGVLLYTYRVRKSR